MQKMKEDINRKVRKLERHLIYWIVIKIDRTLFYLNIYINEASFDQLFFEILHLFPSQSISFLLKDVAKFRC